MVKRSAMKAGFMPIRKAAGNQLHFAGFMQGGAEVSRGLVKISLIMCLFVAGGIVANAQIESNITVSGNVPFTFTAGNATLPAGDYEIRTLEDMPGTLVLRNAKGNMSVLVETDNVIAPNNGVAKRTEFVFNKIGNEYFLEQVWIEGTTNGSELLKSKMEERLSRNGRTVDRHSLYGWVKRMK